MNQIGAFGTSAVLRSATVTQCHVHQREGSPPGERQAPFLPRRAATCLSSVPTDLPLLDISETGIRCEWPLFLASVIHQRRFQNSFTLAVAAAAPPMAKHPRCVDGAHLVCGGPCRPKRAPALEEPRVEASSVGQCCASVSTDETDRRYPVGLRPEL